MANIITGIRIVLSVILMFCPALSPEFYVLYIIAGVSDMIDGAVARKTNTVSEFGSRLDTIAVGYLIHKELITVHSTINRVTGVLLFLLPMTFTFIDLKISAVIICVAATVAAIHEGHLIMSG